MNDNMHPESADEQSIQHDSPHQVGRLDRLETVRWWIKLIVQPILFFALLIAAVVGLGLAQRFGWLADRGGGSGRKNAAASGGKYICPMMCTPPQSEPGRCPVCAMELVATTSVGGGGKRYIDVDSASRRIAKIETAQVAWRSTTRTIRAVGEIRYDEGSLKTISAYVDGRIDRLYADFTGVTVKEGDDLALLYSPKLYSGQVELLLAKKAHDQGQSSTLKRVAQSSRELYASARQRLLELGMTETQLETLEKSGTPSNRLRLPAPIGGTVIEKLAVEGQYIKEGQPIYRLADLRSVWLTLELFPDDAAAIRYGQRVNAEVRSLPGETFVGRVAFVDPSVDPKTRTVGVRVVIANQAGRLRIGEYATATIEARVGSGNSEQHERIYDPELAKKFVSPRHPHIVRDTPGECPICGVDLVPAAQLGFSDKPVELRALVVPRDAVLMAGADSVIYVETKPGRFEIRKVVLGPTQGDEIVVLKGVAAGEHIATRGNFLIDSQMQLAGNPSLIDPTRASPLLPELSGKVMEVLAKLGEEDRKLAEKQRICPVTDLELGAMGVPIKVNVQGQEVFICCEACRDRLLTDPETHLVKLTRPPEQETPSEEDALDLPPIGDFELVEPESEGAATKGQLRIAESLAKLSPADQALARRQKICPVGREPLGSMGAPVKVNVGGNSVFICCEGCRASLLKEPQKHLGTLPKGAVR